MSHIEDAKIAILSLDAIERALARFPGAKLVRGQRTHKWFGTLMGDYQLPKEIDAETMGQCDHAITLNYTTYEVGLVKKKNGPGWILAYDFWGPGIRLKEAFGTNLSKLVDEYQHEVIAAKAKQRGYKVHRVDSPAAASKVNAKLLLTGKQRITHQGKLLTVVERTV